MSVVATIAQVLSAMAAAIAAWAAVRTSGAAVRTAERADLTSERAAEALSRTVWPDLYVRLDTNVQRGAEPQPANVVVINRAPHGGVLLGVRIERRGGAVMAEHRPSVPIPIGPKLPGAALDDPDRIRRLPLAKLPRARTDVPVGDIQFSPREPDLAYVIEFSDASNLTEWTQRGEINELISVPRRDDGGEPVPHYRYETVERGVFEPERLRPLGSVSPSRRKGWLRR